MIEAYHKGLKSGRTIERHRLERAARMRALLGLLTLIAVRLRQGREVARRMLEAVAHGSVPVAFTRTVAHRQKLAAEAMPTARSSVTKLGGFLGRRSDGEPGWQSLWADPLLQPRSKPRQLWVTARLRWLRPRAVLAFLKCVPKIYVPVG